MSFDLFFIPAAASESGERARLDDAHVTRIDQLLRASAAAAPRRRNWYAFEFKDGGAAEITTDDLATGCMMVLRGITPDVCALAFELLSAAPWVLVPAAAEPISIVASPELVRLSRDAFENLATCRSPIELAILLADGVAAWERYRDSATRPRSEPQ